ncbi:MULTISPECIES: SLATT domain-containing protein [unclassified Bradyrhizobium]|uniref:SLATT domain-containing protein n=1 Tax=unclassified Bradyrhizobium TaxID=2631580 RepID=UPI00247AD67E|nr:MULTISPECIES: SLATT domain-containing protein [unclassified Bradyrhizobium]WGR70285.1 SLATT domain-containing protein [Bradyrhizobium sp. ISRA426]WGR82344.1 SLATT domain-containing protein [Bradyrhizobium sp. ISRA430]WGR85529.1 SLATT domain-containing protein [Bradyrhizobium sp. ISRA432]
MDEAKRLEETTLCSSKGHHNAAAAWASAHLWLGLPTTILSTLVGAASFAQFAKQSPEIALAAGCISIAIAVLSGIITFLNPNKREAAHLAAAHAFDRLNNEARVFWSVDCWLEKSEVVLGAKLRDLIDRKADLNTKSPQIPRRAYERAKAGIDAGEADFKVDKVNQNSAQPTIFSPPQPAAIPRPITSA